MASTSASCKFQTPLRWAMPLPLRRTCSRVTTSLSLFIGLCSFYRRFIKGFAAIAEPLTRVMGKTKPFYWGPEQQEAFDTLKGMLMAYPI